MTEPESELRAEEAATPEAKKKRSAVTLIINLLMVALVVLAIGMAMGFFGFVRTGLRAAVNEDLSGQEAPTIDNSDWVLPAGMNAPKNEGWRVVAFFKDH